VYESPILVVSPSWQTRALLAAQIGEATDLEVVSAASVNEALGLIKLRGIDPVLMVADVGQQIGREGGQRLMEAKADVPLVAIASRFRRDALDSLRDRCAACLMRPVSVGRVAEVVAQLLEDRR
jgi:DNA-binding NtrC family response regulator